MFETWLMSEDNGLKCDKKYKKIEDMHNLINESSDINYLKCLKISTIQKSL
jgi:hypothetical protein